MSRNTVIILSGVTALAALILFLRSRVSGSLSIGNNPATDPATVTAVSQNAKLLANWKPQKKSIVPPVFAPIAATNYPGNVAPYDRNTATSGAFILGIQPSSPSI